MSENNTTNEQPSVLVIDDEGSIRKFFLDLFDEMGVIAEAEPSGTDGLKAIQKGSYSLIFLDVKLGDMSGIDVLKEIKNGNPQSKVVIISGYLTESLIDEALKAGADGYLFKPLIVRDILSLTHKFIGPGPVKGYGG